MTTSQLKEELLDGEDYSFLQGASDQESNGSATVYIKQEPWGGSETKGGRGCWQDWFVVIQLHSELFYWDILLNTEKFSSRFFRWGGNYFGGGAIFQFIKMDDFCVVFEAFERIL